MAKKLAKDIKMVNNIFMRPNGQLYQLHGGWHKNEFGSIPKSSKTYGKIVDTYGTSQGAKVRKVAVAVILKHGKWKIGK